MLEQFTIEEINLICIFDTSSRVTLIEELRAVLQDSDEAEMRELAQNIIARLEKLTDAEFAALDLYPEYEDYDEMEE